MRQIDLLVGREAVMKDLKIRTSPTPVPRLLGVFVLRTVVGTGLLECPSTFVGQSYHINIYIL